MTQKITIIHYLHTRTDEHKTKPQKKHTHSLTTATPN